MVSVVIPCYNHGHLLQETVQSVLESTYPDLEILIVDDGSIDNSGEVGRALAAQYPSVSYYYQENAGPSAARNNRSEERRVGKECRTLRRRSRVDKKEQRNRQ